MKLKTKLRIGSKYKHNYDRPQTPYRRILACESVPQETKEVLTQIFKTLNPFRLTKDMGRKLRTFYKANTPVADKEAA